MKNIHINFEFYLQLMRNIIFDNIVSFIRLIKWLFFQCLTERRNDAFFRNSISTSPVVYLLVYGTRYMALYAYPFLYYNVPDDATDWQ